MKCRLHFVDLYEKYFPGKSAADPYRNFALLANFEFYPSGTGMQRGLPDWTQ